LKRLTSTKGSSTSLAKDTEKELLAKQVKVIDEKKRLIQDETVEKGSVCTTFFSFLTPIEFDL
jgi:hypothetical protein